MCRWIWHGLSLKRYKQIVRDDFEHRSSLEMTADIEKLEQ